jgi:hypothetical protein
MAGWEEADAYTLCCGPKANVTLSGCLITRHGSLHFTLDSSTYVVCWGSARGAPLASLRHSRRPLSECICVWCHNWGSDMALGLPCMQLETAVEH